MDHDKEADHSWSERCMSINLCSIWHSGFQHQKTYPAEVQFKEISIYFTALSRCLSHNCLKTVIHIPQPTPPQLWPPTLQNYWSSSLQLRGHDQREMLCWYYTSQTGTDSHSNHHHNPKYILAEKKILSCTHKQIQDFDKRGCRNSNPCCRV